MGGSRAFGLTTCCFDLQALNAEVVVTFEGTTEVSEENDEWTGPHTWLAAPIVVFSLDGSFQRSAATSLRIRATCCVHASSVSDAAIYDLSFYFDGNCWYDRKLTTTKRIGLG